MINDIAADIQHVRVSARRTRRKRTWTRFRQNGLPLVGTAWLLICIFMAIIGPHFFRQPVGYFNMFSIDHPPSWTHPFGTDGNGRDMLTRVVRGLAPTLEIAFLGTVIIVAIGLLVGVTAGMLGGFVDSLLMRFTEFAFAIPGLVISVIIVIEMGLSVWSMSLALGLVGWAGCARLVRGLALSIRNGEMLEAATVAGGSRFYIATRYVVPNVVSNLLVFFAFQLGTVLFQETIVLGMDPRYMGNSNTLSDVLLEGAQSILGDRWQLWGPLVVFLSIMLSTMWIGDGLRAAFNPQSIYTSRRKRKRMRQRLRKQLPVAANATAEEGTLG